MWYGLGRRCVGDLMRARQRLGKLLLRHDVRYEDTASAWTVAHRGWLTSLDLGERGAQVTLPEYLGAIDAIVAILAQASRCASESTSQSAPPSRGCSVVRGGNAVQPTEGRPKGRMGSAPVHISALRQDVVRDLVE
jgi:hypothetical protein